MLKVLTPEEMANADKSAIGSGINSFGLMLAAGRAVAEASAAMMGGTYGRRVVVLCGKGNNGGDGLVAARYLSGRGTLVKVLLAVDGAPGTGFTDAPGLRGDARKALEFFLEDPGSSSVGPLLHDVLEHEVERSDLCIDALVGTGFRGALRGRPAEAVELVNRLGPGVVSVDIPSGVDGATGRIEGSAVRAKKTVTLGALKPGLLLYPGSEHAGEIEIAQIGIGDEHMKGEILLAEREDVASALPRRNANSHKRSVGKVLVVAGSPGMSGAAFLTSMAALRTGAGLVWVAAPKSLASLIEANAVEVVVHALPETEAGSISESAVEEILQLASQADSVALGPGLSRHDETRRLIRRLLSLLPKPLIVDADGLNAFQRDADQIRGRTAPTILTPHSGELARLLDEDVKQIDGSRIDSARRAAALTGATVLLKGKPSFVARSGRMTAVNTGGPFLASAGTGDVLTGVIAALAASIDPYDAAWAGAWLHGIAGRLSTGNVTGPSGNVRRDRGFLATDLLTTLPEALAFALGEPFDR